MQSAARSTPAQPVNFEELLQKLDREIVPFAPHLVNCFRFDINGMVYEVRRVSHEEGYRFLISVTIGFLPFSIESTDRREAIRSIVRATQRLPIVHFALTPASKITAGGVFEVSRLEAPDFVFYPLILFIQQARPFMDLIGKYLGAPAAGGSQTPASSDETAA